MTRVRRCALGVVAACVLAGSAAAAPPPARATAATEEARALFRKGDYRGALDVLEREQKAAPDPRLFWNMAACENKLGRHARAIGYVERYLAATPGLTADERTSAVQFVTAAKAYVGSVTVTSNVDGTQVLVDDELVGTTPLAKPFAVDQGERRVRFVRPGYQTLERTESVPGGAELTWTAELLRPSSGAGGAAIAPPALRPSRVGPLVLAGGGLVFAGIGAALVGVSLGQASQLRSDCGSSCAPSQWGKYRTMQDIGDVMLVVGSVAVAAGVAWWLLQPKNGGDAPRAWIAPTIGGLAFGARL